MKLWVDKKSKCPAVRFCGTLWPIKYSFNGHHGSAGSPTTFHLLKVTRKCGVPDGASSACQCRPGTSDQPCEFIHDPCEDSGDKSNPRTPTNFLFESIELIIFTRFKLLSNLIAPDCGCSLYIFRQYISIQCIYLPSSTLGCNIIFHIWGWRPSKHA